MPDTQPTIYDVAELAQVSISTVSRVLNSSSSVSTKTRDKVMAAVDKLGFVPKAEARARAMQGVGRIGAITPFFTAPSFVQRMRGVASQLMGTDYELVVYTVDSKDRLEGYLAKLPLAKTLDGVVVMSLQIDDVQARRLIDHGLETVLIEFPQPAFSTVEIDDVAGGRMAAQYLLSKGHRRLAFLGDTDLPEYAIHPVSLRLAGFRQVLKDAGIALPDEFVVLAPYTQDQTRLVARHLLSQPHPPSAIFAATDFQAIGVLKVARELGLSVPGDLAIIGFDDLDIAEMMELTTVRQPLDESGRLAVELLLGRLADPNRPPQHIHLPLEVIERKTV
ncbi:MAG: LacI family transcriptional regulator [Chloroflexi bacterium]|nr:LacI family transcriptional regulator [Chloroflexota bacterium]